MDTTTCGTASTSRERSGEDSGGQGESGGLFGGLHHKNYLLSLIFAGYFIDKAIEGSNVVVDDALNFCLSIHAGAHDRVWFRRHDMMNVGQWGRSCWRGAHPFLQEANMKNVMELGARRKF